MLFLVIMIVEFTFKNFKSFKQEQTLSLEAESLKTNTDKLITTNHGLKLLPNVAIFGANASGKSNIFHALEFLLMAIKNTDAINNPTPESSRLMPFMLDTKSPQDATLMQLILWDPKQKREYCYGFEITKRVVISEWLSFRSKVSEKFSRKKIFHRQKQNFTGSNFDHLPKQLAKNVRPDILALPVFAQFNHQPSVDFLDFIIDSLKVVHFNHAALFNALKAGHQNPETLRGVIELIKRSDIGIQNIQIDKQLENLADAPPGIQNDFIERGYSTKDTVAKFRALTRHRVYGGDNKKKIDFSLYDQESDGTLKLFILATTLIEAFRKGVVFFIDELDAGMHPLLVAKIIGLVENQKINTAGVQLIYSSHAPHLLSHKVNLRRDQVWFTEKDKQEESNLKCLSEYKTKKDYEIARNYLVGRFGAVPILNFNDDFI